MCVLKIIKVEKEKTKKKLSFKIIFRPEHAEDIGYVYVVYQSLVIDNMTNIVNKYLLISFKTSLLTLSLNTVVKMNLIDDLKEKTNKYGCSWYSFLIRWYFRQRYCKTHKRIIKKNTNCVFVRASNQLFVQMCFSWPFYWSDYFE